MKKALPTRQERKLDRQGFGSQGKSHYQDAYRPLSFLRLLPSPATAEEASEAHAIVLF